MVILGLGCAAGGGVACAADVPPELVGQFTRRVQPLLLNKCGAGACHGGPAAHEPRLLRPDVHGTIDRRSTLANLDTFLAMLGPDRDPQPLVTRLSMQHPREPTSRRLVMKPLTAGERIMIESWIDALADAEGQVRMASHEEAAPETATPAPTRPNRFKVLLETGAPPPAPRTGEPSGRTAFAPLIDPRNPARIAVRPESGPPALPGETAGSPPARPDAPASPPPTSRESR